MSTYNHIIRLRF